MVDNLNIFKLFAIIIVILNNFLTDIFKI